MSYLKRAWKGPGWYSTEYHHFGEDYYLIEKLPEWLNDATTDDRSRYCRDQVWSTPRWFQTFKEFEEEYRNL